MTTPTVPRSTEPGSAFGGPAEAGRPAAETVRAVRAGGSHDPATRSGHREYLWNRAWALLAFGPLLPATAVAMSTAPDWTDRVVIAALVAALGGWHAWWILGHPHWWERALSPMAVYFAGIVILLAVLRWYAEIFGLAILGFFPMAFVALPGLWSYPAAALLSVLLVNGGVAGLVRGTVSAPDWLFPLGAGVVAAVIGTMTRLIEREAIRRRETNAELVALAAENAALQERLLEQARRAGVVAERTRLARDMHDTVAQGLAGIVTQLETADAEPAQAARRLGIARELARDSLVEVRRTVAALRPAALDGVDLARAVEREVAGWRERTGVAATCTVTGTPVAGDPAVDEAVLRAAQEALSNAARHAGATRVGVTLSYMEDMLVLDVRDDGRGFDRRRPVGDGFGLSAMRQRVAELGGVVEVETAPGAGTAVSVRVAIDGARR